MIKKVGIARLIITDHKQLQLMPPITLGNQGGHHAWMVKISKCQYFASFSSSKLIYCSQAMIQQINTQFSLLPCLGLFVSPARTNAQDREGTRLLNRSLFLAHNLRCEVVDLVDPERLRLWLNLANLTSLVTILQPSASRWNCCYCRSPAF